MKHLPHANWLRTFEAAARHSSFTAAADELGLTPAAVSQQIRLLEAELNTVLFERLPRGVQLTEMGQAYALPIRNGFSDMAVATDGLFRATKRQLVRVRASISCAALVIAPRLNEFRERHPDVDVELATFVWADRFSAEPSDIEIRFGAGEWDDGEVTHLGYEYAIPVCRPEYAASFGASLDFAALSRRHIVSIRGSETDWPRLADQIGQPLQASAHMTWVDSSLLALQAVMAGEGTTIVFESFAEQYLQQGLLCAPLKDRLGIRPSHYLVRHKGTEDRLEVQSVCSWIRSIYLP